MCACVFCMCVCFIVGVFACVLRCLSFVFVWSCMCMLVCMCVCLLVCLCVVARVDLVVCGCVCLPVLLRVCA